MFEKLNISQIIRYGYGGFFFTAILSISYTSKVKDFVNATGGLVSALVIISFGASIYIFYRYVIGEFVIYPLTHLIHYLIDKKDSPTSITGYLRKTKNIKFGQVREAYTDIRRYFFESAIRENLDLDHSEIHLLWLTSTIGFATYAYISYIGNTDRTIGLSVLLASMLIYVAATIIDIKQHKKEFRLIAESNRQVELNSFLKDHGYDIES